MGIQANKFTSMVSDNLNTMNPDTAISLLFNILASKIDKENEDFKDLVVRLVDHANDSRNVERVKKNLRNDSRLNQINTILVNEYDGKKIDAEARIKEQKNQRESIF